VFCVVSPPSTGLFNVSVLVKSQHQKSCLELKEFW